MANTITLQTITGAGTSRDVIINFTCNSDGTQEANRVIYDNSTLVADVSKGKVLEIWASGSDCVVLLKWDQTTDSQFCAFNPATDKHMSFRDINGLPNPNGTGAVGDILLTTTGLASGEMFTMIIWVDQS